MLPAANELLVRLGRTGTRLKAHLFAKGEMRESVDAVLEQLDKSVRKTLA